ncbi:hypothetical protein ACLE20_04320 [Rhizobium sp. YIM 134829]|uniref:hypothetical protein n=1 Tax=Rhizobium sp. YIM 134829 TaxID=3390453 RepID=UPI003979C10F
MTKLSICLPIDADDPSAEPLIASLLADTQAEIELLVSPGPGVTLEAPADPRLRFVAWPEGRGAQSAWRALAEASTGRWVTLVKPGDALETELTTVIDFLENNVADVDALGWNVFQIDSHDEPTRAGPVAIPVDYHIERLSKDGMLKAFFYWEGSINAPKMPYGLFHGAVRRTVLDAILSLPEADDWQTLVPQYEWAARVLLFADNLAFCARPLSAVNARRYQPVKDVNPNWAFPFTAALGLTGAIAEVQFHCLREFGSTFTATQDFVRACMIDCMMETERPRFVEKGNAYFDALQRFDHVNLAPLFRPEFREPTGQDRRRGLHGKALMVDRFIGGARDAREFYGVVRSMIAPIGLICGGTVA